MRLNGLVFRVRAEIDGAVYEPGPIKASEAEKLTAWTGYGLKEWEMKIVDEADPLAARALLALFAYRRGENVRFASVEIEDVDSVEATFRDETGRVLSIKLDDQNEPMILAGKPVILLDGEEPEPVPTVPVKLSRTA